MKYPVAMADNLPSRIPYPYSGSRTISREGCKMRPSARGVAIMAYAQPTWVSASKREGRRDTDIDVNGEEGRDW